MLLKNIALLSLIFLLIACENGLKGNSSDPSANAGGGTSGGVSGCSNGHCTFQEMWSSNVRSDCVSDGTSAKLRTALILGQWTDDHTFEASSRDVFYADPASCSKLG